MSQRGLLLLLLLLALLPLAACGSVPLGDPETALARVQSYEATGDFDDAAELGGVLAESEEADPRDRAEGAFIAGESEMELGHDVKAFARYRYVLENAPWSEHALAIEQRLFEIGQRMLFGEEYSGWFDDRARGVEVLETLQAHFRSSDRADDALRMVGDYFASEEEFAEAALAYLRVADEYPDSEWAERSLWLAGRMRLLSSGGPQYDRNDLLRARELLDRSLREHPNGVAATQSREDLDLTLELLAACEVYVADFYARRHVPAGEDLRLANAALMFPNTVSGRLARERLQAKGIDVAALAGDPARESIDKLRPTRPRWERERDSARSRTDEEE
jgi:tetratricopeptide (TPR) repeat protein